MLIQRYVDAHVISFQNDCKMNQFMLSFIKFKVMLFRSFDDSVSCFLQNFAISFYKFVVRQNINVIDKFNEVKT